MIVLKKTIALLIILLFLQSLIYHQSSEQNSVNNVFDSINDSIVSNNPEIFVDIPDVPDSDMLIKRDTIPGDFLLKGMFTHDSCVTLDQDGEILVLEDYEDMKDLSVLAQENRFLMYKNENLTWPETNDIYQPLSLAEFPFRNSSMFSSPFTYDTLIEGKVQFVTHMKTVIFKTLNCTFRISLFIYDPITYNTTEILNYEEVLPTDLKREDQKIFNLQLNDTYLIPANNVLKLKFEGKVSDIELNGAIDLYSSKGGATDYQWIINDGEYTNTYNFTKYTYVLGMQIKYRSIKYPDIYVLGVDNETYYNDSMNITINIVGGTQSYYRWDSDSFTSFNSTIDTSIPLTEDWHYLEIKALDEFNNTRISVYKIGYNPTETYLILNNPSNNSLIQGSSLLNFSVSGYDNVSYEWDNNGTEFDLLIVPDYNIYAPNGDGWHNLTFYMSNIFTMEEKFFIFIVDATPPLIVLNNVNNDTLQPKNKLIKVKITDVSSNISVEYKWDNNVLLPWSPSIETIYQTYLPSISGYHYLTVIAEDEYGNSDIKLFGFNTSEYALLIELRTMINESWYYGGDVVDVTISGTNGTVFFMWDDGSLINGTPFIIDDSYLRLNNTYALSMDPSSYHYLTILVFDTFDIEHTIVFEFRLDQENPVIDSSIDDYNNERFRASDILPFIFSDNATDSNDLYVLIAIDGDTYITLSYEFNLILSSLEDGAHYFTLYVFDIAGNNATKYIVFYIDTQGPVINLNSIEGLVTLIDGTKTVPHNSEIIVTVYDDDPLINSYYSWDGSNYIQFTNNFVLDYPDGAGLLQIYVNDSLGNSNILERYLTIDGTAPIVTLEFPFLNTTINGDTELRFKVEEPNMLSIEQISLYWDKIASPFGPNWASLGIFTIPFLELYYDNGSVATLTAYAEDSVGNSLNYTFDFIVDTDIPTTDVYYYDIEVEEYLPIINGSIYQGNTSIWFTNISSDLFYFYVSWDNMGFEIITDPWIIYIPVDDGEHILEILLLDSTGEGTSPNIFHQYFIFSVDDIYIDYITPTDLNDTEIPFNLEYKDSFNFTVEVYDVVENIDIVGLNCSVIENELELDINWDNDSRTFQFSIFATNVTPFGISVSEVILEFSANGTNPHFIQLNLFIDRKDDTTLTIKENSILSAKWEENLTISLSFQDELDNYLVDILQIEINGTRIYEQLHIDSNTITFDYSSRYFMSKGSFSINITVFSTYYKGYVEQEIVIEPLELTLSIEVSAYEIIIDNQLIITASLTYLNGTGLENVDITLTVYVYSQQEGVSALIEGFNFNTTLEYSTNSTGHAVFNFLMTEDIEYIRISVTFEGNEYTNNKYTEFEESITTIPGGLSSYILYPLIGGSLLVIIIGIFIGYKLTRPKPFETLMDNVTEEDISQQMEKVCPGIVLSIFDQQKGPTPIVYNHSLNESRYIGRMVINYENFLLKISDQAYSSLGFEEHDVSRRTGSITLPSEKMVGFIHGIQLENKAVRGGFENLSLIILADSQYGKLLLGHTEYLFNDIDILIKYLKDKSVLPEIEKQIEIIRRLTTIIILAALEEAKDIDNNA